MIYKTTYQEKDLERALDDKQKIQFGKRQKAINRFRGTWEFCKKCGKVYRQEPEVEITDKDGDKVILEKIELCKKCFRQEMKKEKHLGYIRDAIVRGLVLPEDSLHLMNGILSHYHFDKKIRINKDKINPVSNERDDFTPMGVNFWQKI